MTEEMTDAEIIKLLGGVTATAVMLDIKPPSVFGWLKTGIPEGRLRDLAGQIELRAEGRFTRKKRWPNKYAFYWPELAVAHILPAQPAIETVAEAPWDGKTERRKLDAPVDRRVSPESVAQAAFKRSQADIYG